MADNIPVQSGNPTLVPNFYDPYVQIDKGPQNRQILQYLSPKDALTGGVARTAASQTGTVGGTITAGNTITTRFTNPTIPGGFRQVVYTVQAGDTTATVADGIAKAINDDTILKDEGIYATVNNLIVTFRQDGPVGNSTVVSRTLSGGATITFAIAGAGAMSGGSGPIIPTQNFTFCMNNVTEVFWYGRPKYLPYNMVKALVTQGMPIV